MGCPDPRLAGGEVMGLMCTRCPTPRPAWAPGQAEPLHPTFALHLPWGVRGLGQLALPHVLPTAGRAPHSPRALCPTDTRFSYR